MLLSSVLTEVDVFKFLHRFAHHIFALMKHTEESSCHHHTKTVLSENFTLYMFLGEDYDEAKRLKYEIERLKQVLGVFC